MLLFLNFIRGLSALSVVFYHTGYEIGGVHTDFMAVSVFFVISGFIMTKLVREGSDGALGFMLKRVIKVVPLYWVFTLLMVFALLLKGRENSGVDVSSVIRSLVFFPYRDANGDFHPLLGVGWTLNLEFFLYMIYGLVMWISKRWAPLMVSLVICTLLVMGSLRLNWFFDFYGHKYTLQFFFGVIAYYLYKWCAQFLRPGRWISVGAFVSVGALWVAFLAFCLSGEYESSSGAVSRVLGVLFPFFIVLSSILFVHLDLDRYFSFGRMLGEISYSLYLTHTFVIVLVGMIGARLGIGAPSTSAALFFACLILSLVLAYFVNRFLEYPISSYCRRRLLVGS